MTNQRSVVLLGVGHTNALIVRMWRRRAPPNTRLVCISNYRRATYSGMLPGVLAGQYEPQQMQIDLQRLCTAANAELLLDEVIGLDLAGRKLLFRERGEIPFDVLSVGIGSVPDLHEIESHDDLLLTIKPMQNFLQRLDSRLQQLRSKITDRPLRMTIVGGGAGGVEIALCLPRRIESCLGDDEYKIALIEGGDSIPSEFTPKARTVVEQLLVSRGVQLHLGRRVKQLTAGGVALETGDPLPADLVLWATGASAPPLLSQFDLPKDERGFLLTHNTLQSVANAPIFAVGDCGSIDKHLTPKAGVYAVRQAPILYKNIHRLLAGRPLLPYRPQRHFLKLLNTGDNKALLCYRNFAIHAPWCLRLKDQIDRRFIAKFQT